MGVLSTVEGYHEYRGGRNRLLFEYPQGTEHPHGTHDISLRASWYPPTVLSIPHGTQDKPPTVLNTSYTEWLGHFFWAQTEG